MAGSSPTVRVCKKSCSHSSLSPRHFKIWGSEDIRVGILSGEHCQEFTLTDLLYAVRRV